MKDKMTQVRLDHKMILEMIEPGSKVLDLGCGDGRLLQLLKEHHNCRGTGIEIDEKQIYRCIEKGVSVSQGDIDSALDDYSDNQFDYVILNESLQEILNPDKVITQSLRVGKRVIVGIPNFGHLSARCQIFFLGRVPVTRWLPYKWYNTPNLRFLTLRDFRDFCKEKKIRIVDRRAITLRYQVSFMTNLFAYIGIYKLEQGN
jgi:methionine biosynthesis protein MetW